LVHTFVIANLGYLPITTWRPPLRFFSELLWILFLSISLFYFIEKPFLQFKKIKKFIFPLNWPVLISSILIILGIFNFYQTKTRFNAKDVNNINYTISDKYKINSVENFAYTNIDNKIEVACDDDSNEIVILSFGQSNIANYNIYEKLQTNRQVINLNIFNDKCYKSSDPLLGNSGNYSSVMTMVGEDLSLKFPDKKIVLVPFAMGSSRIKDWSDGKYNILIKKAILSLHKNNLKPSVIIWQQGESESGFQDSNGDLYSKQLKKIISEFRKFNIHAPFIASISSICFGENNQRDISVEKGVLNLDGLTNFFVGPNFNLLGFELRSDKCHFNELGIDKQKNAWIEAIEKVLN